VSSSDERESRLSAISRFDVLDLQSGLERAESWVLGIKPRMTTLERVPHLLGLAAIG
jgi:hypothetical protein